MSREDDWKIHEYMGNDLTGYRWEDEKKQVAIIKYTFIDERPLYKKIPHYSTTWEGAGMVMEAFQTIGGVEIGAYGAQNGDKWTEVRHILPSGREIKVTEHDARPALAKAYISAMEERDNE